MTTVRETSSHPLVSVIIPTFNRARFVGEAIFSALSQGSVDLEVIVVDDGSTDETADVVSKFGNRVRYIVQENAGASTARNTGCEASNGAWIALLDSDDVWFPDKISTQLMDLSQNAGAVAHFTNVEVDREFASGTTVFDLREGFTKHFGHKGTLYLERPLELNARYNFARLQSCLIRRDAVFNSGLMDRRFDLFEDTDFLNRVALEGPWVVSKHVSAREIRREEATTGLGEMRISRPYIGYENLYRQTENLLGDPRITRAERIALSERAAGYAFCAASSHIRFADHAAARTILSEDLRRKVSPQNVAAFAATLVPNRILRRLAFK